MAKLKTVRVSEEELAAIKAYRESAKRSPEDVAAEAAAKEKEVTVTAAQQSLADAFVAAIERTKAPEKKTIFSRKSKGPWAVPEGQQRIKLKRKMYQHGLSVEEIVTNEDIALLNRVQPGRYCNGWVHVNLRKDRGIDITYPVRTASQRLKLVNEFGIRSFTELLQRVIDEKTNPSKYRKAEDTDIYDIEA